MSVDFSYGGLGILLTRTQMVEEESRAFSAGISEFSLMSQAGMGCGAFIDSYYRFGGARRALIMCGVGNNGGDGFVIARYLSGCGWDVCVCLVGVLPTSDRGVSGEMLSLWRDGGGCIVFFPDCGGDIFSDYDIVIDALFGTGLSRPISGIFHDVIEIVNGLSCPIIAVDIPSGVCGDSGTVMSIAVRARVTLALHRRKLGHVLLPARDYCGVIHEIDIGIPALDSATAPADSEEAYCYVNDPVLWRDFFPHFSVMSHKYDRGHILSLSGPSLMTGASRLAALSALRMGAGLVTIGCFDKESALVHAHHVTSVMVRVLEDIESVLSFVELRKVRSVIFGPGAGVDSRTRSVVVGLLQSCPACVILDADALTVMGADRDYFASLISARPKSWGGVVLTPHMGEVRRLYGDDDFVSKCDYAVFLARFFSCCVVLKGGDSVIACALGRVVVQGSAPVYLATAGSGDVLAGMIGGLSGMGMDVFHASCCGVWVHSEAGRLGGYGVLAEDLPRFFSDIVSPFSAV